jgi:anti-sigma B factor antagonist
MLTTGMSPVATGGPTAECPVCASATSASSGATIQRTAPCEQCGYLVWFTQEAHGDAQTIKPNVRLMSPDSLHKLIDAVLAAGRKRIAIDFSEVDLLPSACLGKLCRLNKSLQDAGGQLVVCGLSENLLNVFEITGLDRVLTIET